MHWKLCYVAAQFNRVRIERLCVNQWKHEHDKNQIVKQFQQDHEGNSVIRSFKRWRAMYICKIIFGKAGKSKVREYFGAFRAFVKEKKERVEAARQRSLHKRNYC